MKETITIQEIVLHEIYRRGRWLDIAELSDLTKLPRSRVRTALVYLKRRGLIRKKYVPNPEKTRKYVPPFKKVTANIRPKAKEYAERILRMRGLIE